MNLHRLPFDPCHLLIDLGLFAASLAPALAHVAQRQLHDLLVLPSILVEGDRRLGAVDKDPAVLAPVARLGDPVLSPVHTRGGQTRMESSAPARRSASGGGEAPVAPRTWPPRSVALCPRPRPKKSSLYESQLLSAKIGCDSLSVSRAMQRPCVLLTLLAGSLCPSACFYLPGVAPREYVYGERVELKVNKLTSTKTQLPYEYYALPFCQPEQVCGRGDGGWVCVRRA